MGDLSILADVEALAITAVRNGITRIAGMDGLSVGTKIPSDATTRREFVRLFASNIQTTTLVTHSFALTVEGWAATEVRAQEICGTMAAILREEDSVLFDFQELGGGNVPHPDFPTLARYQSLMSGRSRDKIIAF